MAWGQKAVSGERSGIISFPDSLSWWWFVGIVFLHSKMEGTILPSMEDSPRRCQERL